LLFGTVASADYCQEPIIKNKRLTSCEVALKSEGLVADFVNVRESFKVQNAILQVKTTKAKYPNVII
jgi:hypothetical protein